MKLIGNETSPFVRKVRIVLAEKKLDYSFELDNPWSPDALAPNHNPLGKVPILILENGESIFDSRVIVEYLDTLTPLNKLIPGTSRDRTAIKVREALSDGLLDAAVAARLELTWAGRKDAERCANWVARQEACIVRGLKEIADTLEEKTWCIGNQFCLADISVGVLIGYLEFRMPELLKKNHYPNLMRLHERLMQRPSFAATLPH